MPRFVNFFQIVRKQILWEVEKWLFDGQLSQNYFRQKLLKSDHPFSSYDRKCRGYFLLGHNVDSMMKILCASCFVLFPAISTQFTLEMCVAAQKCDKNSLKPFTLGV